MWEGTVSRNLFWLTDEQWAKIAPLLPTHVRGKPS
jgi:transposase